MWRLLRVGSAGATPSTPTTEKLNDPFRMKAIEIGDVEAVQDASVFGGVGQMLIVGFRHQAGIRSRGHCHAARAKSGNEAAMYRILIDIDLEKLH